ncbi:hypothetical protein AS594_07010 [Streptomyces agglomeratus]|uniref:Uncharacterized protein n=2 Tax=Streptomyces agglomeratus TaxID=285458 RepID=A0A1E5P3Z8_9ACTN|nr:hypothetical protein AS594_07010 [Streptomyces agglomeratus]
MFGFTDPVIRFTNPVIRECTWRDHVVSPEIYQADLRYAAQLENRMYQWDGMDREGRPMVVVWTAGKRAGALFSAYEFTERGEQS